MRGSTKANKPELLDVGLYTPTEVARILGIHPSTIARWIEGYSFPLANHFRSKRPPVFVPALPRIQGRITVTFLDLVQLRVVRAFREAGVTLPRIRVAGQTAGDVFGTSHPLAHLRLSTDGRSVWSVIGRGDGLVDLSSGGQTAFPELVASSLKEITYASETGLAERWYAAGPGGGVVLDPSVAFGAPVTVDDHVPTRAIWDQSISEPNPERLANWFEIDVVRVHDALRFERRLAQAA